MSERTKSPRRGMCAAILVLEALTLALAVPVMIAVGEVPVGAALAAGLGLAALCVLASGLLRRPWGYQLGWALQVGAVALGFLLPTMFGLGALFVLLWGTADLLGRKIERERAAAFAAYDARQAAEG